MLRIRLSRTGKKRQPSYRVVVAEKESKRDGRRLAFSQAPTDAGTPLAIHDLASGKTQIAGIVPDALYVSELRWSADDTLLIAGANHGEGRYDIWTLPAAPNSTAERLIADAVLIDAVPTVR